VGFTSQVLHNALRTSTDILSIDAETIVNKKFQYFHINTIQVEGMKEFCDFVDVECKQILGSVKARWISLQPAIIRGIFMLPTLKSYFFPKKNSRQC
jgi:hypothetical protein